MYIENMNIWQGRQNAVGTVSSIPASTGGGGSSSAFPHVSVSSVGETTTPQVQPDVIATGISYLKDQLEKLLTSFPPFFPVGSYQRADLITKVKGLEERIQEFAKSSSNPAQTDFGEFETLKDDASDQEISNALDRLFEFRNTVVPEGSTATVSSQPGLILNKTV